MAAATGLRCRCDRVAVGAAKRLARPDEGVRQVRVVDRLRGAASACSPGQQPVREVRDDLHGLRVDELLVALRMPADSGMPGLGVDLARPATRRHITGAARAGIDLCRGHRRAAANITDANASPSAIRRNHRCLLRYDILLLLLLDPCLSQLDGGAHSFLPFRHESRLNSCSAMTMELIDAQLVGRCRAGEAAAWNELVERFSRYVYAIAVRAYRLPEHDAEDVFQDDFARAYERLGSLRDDTAIRPRRSAS